MLLILAKPARASAKEIASQYSSHRGVKIHSGTIYVYIYSPFFVCVCSYYSTVGRGGRSEQQLPELDKEAGRCSFTGGRLQEHFRMLYPSVKKRVCEGGREGEIEDEESEREREREREKDRGGIMQFVVSLTVLSSRLSGAASRLHNTRIGMFETGH